VYKTPNFSPTAIPFIQPIQVEEFENENCFAF